MLVGEQQHRATFRWELNGCGVPPAVQIHIAAGSRLQLTIELRDRFSNPCSWARGELNAEMVGLGVVDGDEISKAEAGPRRGPPRPSSREASRTR